MKFLLALIILALLGMAVHADDSSDEMLSAYLNTDYAKAQRLAEKMPDNPKAKLVLVMCQFFNPLHQDLKGGLAALAGLYEDRSLPLDVWLQAALTYGRIAQLVQARSDLYGNLASDIDTDKVFKEIINKAPDNREACTALVFDLTKEFESTDNNTIDAAFAWLEKFCRDFKGKPEYLLPVHLIAEQKYIALKSDYSVAVKHLEEAYKLGIANPKDTELDLYRLGRIYDLKLKNHDMAVKYYTEFLKVYPESGYAPAVERFLSQLNPPTEKER